MDTEKERKLFTEYPRHIAMLVKVVEMAIKEGRMRIEGGNLVMNSGKTGIEEAEKKSASDDK